MSIKPTLIALAAGVLAMAMPLTPADARVRGAIGLRSGPVHARPFHARRGFVAPLIIAGPLLYTGSCQWLKHRAIETGSRYWWRRYRQCRGW